MPWYRRFVWQLVLGVAAGVVLAVVLRIGLQQSARAQALLTFLVGGAVGLGGFVFLMPRRSLIHWQAPVTCVATCAILLFILSTAGNDAPANWLAIMGTLAGLSLSLLVATILVPGYRLLHWQIIVGLGAGLFFGLMASGLGWSQATSDWIKPWGTIFINLLKLIAVPLVLSSLVVGVASLSDMTKLSRIGGKTIAIYVATTMMAIVIGLVLVNNVKPGAGFTEEDRKNLQAHSSEKEIKEREEEAAKIKEKGPLAPVVDIVPENVISSASFNKNLLQIVFFALFLGVGLILVEPDKSAPLRAFFEGLNEAMIKLAILIMKMAPIGVFALIASVITDLAKNDPRNALTLLSSLAWYCGTVLSGLMLHILLVYVVLLRLFTPIKVGRFFIAMRPAQLLAFSSSSSAATLPVTKECCEKNLGVSPEVTSFTLPLGATINMDGTALYQAVAAIFIVQVLGGDLTIIDQITKILLPVTLASIGTAAVPSAGIIMLVIIIQGISIPIDGRMQPIGPEHVALVLGVDRLLDMMRTVTNVTGDAVVTSIVAHTEGKLDATDEAGGSEPTVVGSAKEAASDSALLEESVQGVTRQPEPS